jgi:hypothetical protein
MAMKFTMKFEVGSQAPVPVVAGLVADLNVVTQSAYEVATHVAEAEADARLTQLVREGGVRALIDEALRRGFPVGFQEGDTEFLERDLGATLGLPVPPGRRPLYSFLVSSSLPYDPMSVLVGQLRSGELARRLPYVPYRFGHLEYRNPLIVEIAAEVGAAATGLAALLAIVRDWGPRRSRQQLENDRQQLENEELRNANAFKSRLRGAYVRAVERGVAPPLGPGDLDALGSADLALAVDGLAHRLEVLNDDPDDPDDYGAVLSSGHDDPDDPDDPDDRDEVLNDYRDDHDDE